MPTSGTAVRDNPMDNWAFLPRVTRPYFAKRVCVFGPESTGKSTLCSQLAKHFDSVYVPEYARTHIEAHHQHSGKELSRDDMLQIARGQRASEDAIVFNANRVLFCDTDLLTTTIWSHWLFNDCDPWIVEQADKRDYDLYLVTDVDVPWVEDVARYLPQERQSFLDHCLRELNARNRKFVMLSGGWDARLSKAIGAVEELLS